MASLNLSTVPGDEEDLPERFSSSTLPVRWNLFTRSLIVILVGPSLRNFQEKSSRTGSYVNPRRRAQTIAVLSSIVYIKPIYLKKIQFISYFNEMNREILDHPVFVFKTLCTRF